MRDGSDTYPQRCLRDKKGSQATLLSWACGFADGGRLRDQTGHICVVIPLPGGHLPLHLLTPEFNIFNMRSYSLALKYSLLY